MSTFDCVQQAPPIEVFFLTQSFTADTFPQKVNLGVGAYRTEESKPWVLPIVRKVEKELAEDMTLNKEYLPVLGLPELANAASVMLLGKDSKVVKEGKYFGIQTLSGTGSLRIVGEFFARHVGSTVVYSSDPTWENHRLIFMNAGFKQYSSYRYWDAAKKSLDIDGMIQDLNNAPEGSVIILHACAHNPTRIDPTREQWKRIGQVFVQRKLFPLFDSAYQGFASGDLDNDAWAVRYFADELGLELVCCQSFAKNFGLYNERIGNLTFVTNTTSNHPQIKSQMTLLIRGMYSNPPVHGARIVARVLTNPEYYEEWKGCIRTMSGRIKEMRAGLQAKLIELGTKGDWNHITEQIGMFSYTGLSEPQVEYLKNQYHIYMLKSGRINMCGITNANMDYVAKAIKDAVDKY